LFDTNHAVSIELKPHIVGLRTVSSTCHQLSNTDQAETLKTL